MKANIITLNGYRNYGNRLQNYALTITLSKIGIEASTPWQKTCAETIKSIIRKMPIIRKRFTKANKLAEFTKKYNTYRHTNRSTDVTIFGSDQIWNPNCIEDDITLLKNKYHNTKAISYAASMGVENLDKRHQELFKKELKNYRAISVREKSAKELLQPLTDKKIEIVLDPTLLLEKDEYESLEKKPGNITENEKYILCYILGNRDCETVIENFAKEKGYRTIYFSDKRDSNYGIEEFLYLIHHAQLICTDSFHACVFSFIFERPFVAFKRTGKENYMYTRLQNLIDAFKLKNREFNGKEITEANQKADFSEAKKILEKEQEKSLAFLKRAIEGLDK